MVKCCSSSHIFTLSLVLCQNIVLTFVMCTYANVKTNGSFVKRIYRLFLGSIISPLRTLPLWQLDWVVSVDIEPKRRPDHNIYNILKAGDLASVLVVVSVLRATLLMSLILILVMVVDMRSDWWTAVLPPQLQPPTVSQLIYYIDMPYYWLLQSDTNSLTHIPQMQQTLVISSSSEIKILIYNFQFTPTYSISVFMIEWWVKSESCYFPLPPGVIVTHNFIPSTHMASF